jgi:hypothetical protein
VWLWCWLWAGASCAIGHATEVRTGDLVLQRSRSAQSAFIALATRSPWTHAGVVFVRDGEPLVLEAGDPVGYVPLDVWAARAADGRIAIRRLADPGALEGAALGRLDQAAAKVVGRRYDAAFAWSDDRLYCSELAYKLLTEAVGRPVAELRAFRSFDLSDPRVAAAVRERWGDPPLDEPVVAPADLYADPGWTTLCEGPIDGCL